MRSTQILLSVVCILLVSCQKTPEGLEDIQSHPEFVGDWMNIDPPVLENDRWLFSALEIGSGGFCRFDGGLKDSKGTFGYKNENMYIGSRSFGVQKEPRALDWMVYVTEPGLEYASHAMQLREETNQMNVSHKMVKFGYEEVDGRPFFEGVDSLLIGSSNGNTVEVRLDSNDARWLEIRIDTDGEERVQTLGDSSSYRTFRNEDELFIVAPWSCIKFQREEGILYISVPNGSVDEQVFDQPEALINRMELAAP